MIITKMTIFFKHKNSLELLEKLLKILDDSRIRKYSY